MELEESTCPTSDYTTKLLSSRQYGSGTMDIQINGTKQKAYMQNRKRDTDVQNRLGDSVGEGEDCKL